MTSTRATRPDPQDSFDARHRGAATGLVLALALVLSGAAHAASTPVTAPTSGTAKRTAAAPAAKPATAPATTPARAPGTPGAPLVPSTIAKAPAGPRDAATLNAKVSYIAGGTIYLEVGREDGLRESDTLAVSRTDVAIARLKVTFLSSHRAACDTLQGGSNVKTGDVVRFVAHDHTIAPPPTTAATRAPLLTGSPVMPIAAKPKRERSPLHGRIGSRFLSVQDKSSGGGFSQPALDVLVNGSNLSGVPMDFSLDARSRRTTRTVVGGAITTDAATRVYRASLALHDRPSRFRMTIGRQTSPTLSSVSIFDGVLAEYTGPRLSGGLFSGTQPDPVQDNISSAIFEHGAYVELHQKPLATKRWSMALGGVTSTQSGQVNRDFMFTQAYWQTPAFSASVDQEVDVNRGWKLAAGEHRFTPTSTFVLLRAQVAKPLSMNIGYDNRRNVRLYRDFVTPVTQFDDQYRDGGWVGASLELGRYIRLDGDARKRGGGNDKSDAWSAGGQVARLGFWNLTLHSRYSTYSSTTNTSSLTSVGLGMDPISVLHLETTGGTRMSKAQTTGASETVRWMGGDLDLTLARRWYLNGSIEHDQGGVDNLTQEYVGLSWRF